MSNLFFIYPIYGDRGVLFFGTETTQEAFNKAPFTNSSCRHISVEAAKKAGIILPVNDDGRRVTPAERTLLLRESLLQPR